MNMSMEDLQTFVTGIIAEIASTGIHYINSRYAKTRTH